MRLVNITQQDGKSWTHSTTIPEKVFADFAAVIPRYLATYGNIEDAWLEMWLKTIPTSAEARLRRMRGEASSGVATAQKLASPEYATSLEAAYMRSSILYMDYVKLRSFINLPDQTPLRDAAAPHHSSSAYSRAMRSLW